MFEPGAVFKRFKVSQSEPERMGLNTEGRAVGLFCLALMMSLLLSFGVGGRVALAQSLVESVNLKKVKTGKKIKSSSKVQKKKRGPKRGNRRKLK